MSSSMMRATFLPHRLDTLMFLAIGPFTVRSSANLSCASMASSLTVETVNVLLFSNGSIVWVAIAFVAMKSSAASAVYFALVFVLGVNVHCASTLPSTSTVN